jgi:hypothetical protein
MIREARFDYEFLPKSCVSLDLGFPKSCEVTHTLLFEQVKKSAQSILQPKPATDSFLSVLTALVPHYNPSSLISF